MYRLLIFIFMITATLSLAHCGKGGTATDGSSESGDCAGGGWCGDEAVTVTADLSGSKALFTLQDNSSSVLSSISETPTKEAKSKALVGTQSKLYKLLNDGTYEEVITATSSTSSDAKSNLPVISYMASNNQGDVFIAYQYPFMYRTPPSSYSDPWSPSSPYTCQLFKVKSTIADFSSSPSTADSKLCCITNSLELDTWDYRTNKIQFDSSGNAYFTAHVPQNWKNVMLKWDRSSTPDIDSDGVCTYPSTALSEVINANIMFRDYLVVPTGGVFYTGSTSTNGQFNDGDSFLRFRTNSGQLQEITSGWWDYIFQPVDVDDTLLGIDANLSFDESTVSERVIFYGPDPLVATSPEWDDSCLFLYDPNLSGSARSTQISDCNIDIWNYVSWADELATRKSRCTETKYMMGGGNQPKKIVLADSYDSDSNYIQSTDYTEADGKKEIFVVGDIYYKKAGEWRYDLWINEAHCTIGDVPSFTYNGNQAGCTSNSGTWVANGTNYNQLTSSTLLTAIEDGDDTAWQINGQWCESPGGEWRATYSAIARVNYTDADTQSITLLSATDEIVKNGWAVNSRLFYVAFNVDDGAYYLMEVGSSTPVLTGYEVYELFRDPNNANKLYFNGLKFSNNSYVMGTFDPDDVDGSFTEETGITGQIETLIVIPDALLQ